MPFNQFFFYKTQNHMLSYAPISNGSLILNPDWKIFVA